MNLNYYQFIVFIAILSHFCIESKFHISQSKLKSSCDVYTLIDQPTGYKDFFHVSSMNKNLKKENERLHLKFYVMTWKYANILLSVNNTMSWDDKNSDRGYVIALGNYKNTISLISTRSAPGSDIVIITGTSSPNMLRAFDPLLVEIIQKNDGELIVNIPGYAEPLMKVLDTNPANINFFSFSCWDHTPMKWFYNCQFDENSYMEDQKTNEEHLFNSKSLTTDPNMKLLMDFFWSGVFNRHKSFFHGIVPALDKFDEDQVIEFQQGVIELLKKVKKTSTIEKPMIDKRSGF